MIPRLRTCLAVTLATATLVATALVALTPTKAAAACPTLPGTLPAAGALPAVTELPDPFRYYDGTRLTTPSDWSCRRDQLRELLQYYQYGHLPAAPTSVTGTRNGNTLTVTVTANGRSASFNATLSLPSGSGPFPAIIMLNPLAASATSRGYAEVRIDPNSIAADSSSKTGAFWTLYGSADVDTGVLMAWAWGVHRTLDALSSVPQIDVSKVGVSGYSRYGKAALVAGAFDERIAATFPGSSGTAGMGNHRFFFATGGNNETLDDITNAFPFWFTSRFSTFRGQANRLPFDQHSLVALIAPRLLLATNGTEGSDIRTNPQGAGLTYRGGKMVYQYLGVPERIGVNYRPGGHQIDMADYTAIMDFSDKYLKGLPVSRTFDNVPYPNTPAAIPWTIPAGTDPTGTPSTPSSSPGPGGVCDAAYRLVNSWPGGFQGEVVVTAGSSAVNGWSVGWTLASGQSLGQVWGGVPSTSGATVTVRNAAWNGSLAPSGSATFGFVANGTASTPSLECASP